MRLAICPGSFDPITKGHLNVIERASKLFDRIIVVIMVNPDKRSTFTDQQRVSFIEKSTKHLDNVEVDLSHGLVVDYAKLKNACSIVRGLRALTDFEYEFQMSLINKKLNPEVETVFLNTSEEYMYLSSSMVKQISSFGGDISDFVPTVILEDITETLKRRD